jgi:hypothetical protein
VKIGIANSRWGMQRTSVLPDKLHGNPPQPTNLSEHVRSRPPLRRRLKSSTFAQEPRKGRVLNAGSHEPNAVAPCVLDFRLPRLQKFRR